MSPPSHTRRFSKHDEEAGAREPFEDAALYDFEYRRRRADVRYYRRLVVERLSYGAPGPLLDLACGSGRLMLPLLRDGHTVVGVDRSAPMLARAAARLRRLSATRRQRALLVRGDLRALGVARGGFAMAICAFHSVQHLVEDADLLAFLRGVRRSLRPDGWLAFDTLPVDPAWIGRDPTRWWARTVFRHPTTKRPLEYTTSHVYDPVRKALHMRLRYQPLDARGAARGAPHVVRLCHRQTTVDEMTAFLSRAGFAVLGVFGGFDGRAFDERDGDQHIFVAKPRVKRAPTPGRHRREFA